MSMGYTAEYVQSKSPDEIAREMTDVSNRRIHFSNQVNALEKRIRELEAELTTLRAKQEKQTG